MVFCIGRRIRLVEALVVARHGNEMIGRAQESRSGRTGHDHILWVLGRSHHPMIAHWSAGPICSFLKTYLLSLNARSEEETMQTMLQPAYENM